MCSELALLRSRYSILVIALIHVSELSTNTWVFLQIVSLSLGTNRLTGTLPSSWSNLVQVRDYLAVHQVSCEERKEKEKKGFTPVGMGYGRPGKDQWRPGPDVMWVCTRRQFTKSGTAQMAMTCSGACDAGFMSVLSSQLYSKCSQHTMTLCTFGKLTT